MGNLYGDGQPILQESFVPTAAVTGCRFVDTAGNMITVAGKRGYGIADQFNGVASATDVTNKHAITVITLGSAPLELGTGGATAGDLLMSDATGKGVKWVPGNNNEISAIARETGVAGDRIRAFVLPQARKTSALADGVGAALTVGSNAVAPTSRVHHVGAGLIKNITVPANLEDGAELIFIPDAAFTTDATGNVGKASTAVVAQAMVLVYDATAAKFYPSY